jgi:hypothetical protein
MGHLLRRESRSVLTSLLPAVRLPERVRRWWAKARGAARRVVKSPVFQRGIIVVILANTACLALDRHDQDVFEGNVCRRRCELDPRLPRSALPSCGGPLFNRSWSFDGKGGGVRPPQQHFCFLSGDAALPLPPGSPLAGHRCSSFTDVDSCTAQSACGWILDECRLGLYTMATLAADPQGTATLPVLRFRDLCGGVNDVRLPPTLARVRLPSLARSPSGALNSPVPARPRPTHPHHLRRMAGGTRGEEFIHRLRPCMTRKLTDAVDHSIARTLTLDTLAGSCHGMVTESYHGPDTASPPATTPSHPSFASFLSSSTSPSLPSLEFPVLSDRETLPGLRAEPG